jgi:hypothetical protein
MSDLKLLVLAFVFLAGCGDQNVTVSSGGGNSEQSQVTETLPVEEPVEE